MNENYVYIRQVLYILMTRKITLLCSFFAMLLVSCDNEIDINAPWIETAVVYGFLDANENTQFIRIQKTYQNDVNTSTADGAKFRDSLYFQNISVKVISSQGNEFVFVKDSLIDKQPGFFANQNHFVYRCNNFRPNPSLSYNLIIQIPETGTTFTSRTGIVGPGTFETNIIRYRPDFVNNISFRIRVGNNNFVNDAVVRLRYKEYPTGNPSLAQEKNIDYVLNTVDRQPPNSIFSRIFSFNPVLDYFKRELGTNTAVEREWIGMQYVWISGTEDLKVLMDLSRPSQFIVQRKPDFSNINGGLGIFSSRTTSFTNTVFNIGDDSSLFFINRELGFKQ
jgi:hypothetical protein